MPVSAPRLCPGCGGVVRGRCERCYTPWATKPDSWAGGAGGKAWRRVRAQRLELEPFCRECGDVAREVDHLDGIVYDTDRLKVELTRSLCTPCHRRRTSAQGHEARRRRRGG